MGLRHDERLIPQYLKPLGYATACFGKWNIGFAPGSRPTERGFDEFLGHASGNMDYYTHVYNGRNDLFRGTEPAKVEGYSTDLFADAACDFIRRNAARPFFLYLPFNAVHYPNPSNKKPDEPCVWQAPDKYFKLYGYSPKTRDEKQRYWATVSALDDGVGRVLKQLDDLGLRNRTLVIFLSDNGAFAAQKNCASNGPFRTEKVMIYEGSIRVCCLIRWPGKMRPKSVCDETLISLDLLPLILRAAGARCRVAESSTAAIPPPRWPAKPPRRTIHSFGDTTARTPSAPAATSWLGHGEPVRGNCTTCSPTQARQRTW